jgi:hypothetical protein
MSERRMIICFGGHKNDGEYGSCACVCFYIQLSYPNDTFRQQTHLSEHLREAIHHIQLREPGLLP